MNHLDKILLETRKSVTQLKKTVSIADLEDRINEFSKRSFVENLKRKISQKEIAVIAEIKRSSPSKGVIRENFILIQKCLVG